MPAPNDLDGLNSEQWRELCDCASRLEHTLLGGATAVDLRHFLPAEDAPHRRAVLCELVKTELEARYRRGKGQTLERFLEAYPELGGRDDVPVSLLYEEYRVRRLHGDRPALADYRMRFPRQYEDLTRLVAKNPVPEATPSQEPPTVRSPQRTLTNPPPATPPANQPTRLDSYNTKPGAGKGADLSSMPTDAEGSMSGHVLSHGLGYQKLERLGRGEFGEVWRALAPGGVEVAIKIILRTLDHEASQRELKVLEKIRQLRHPFLLQTHQYQAEKDHLVIVMELADGSLSDRYKECKTHGLTGIPADELATYFTQAAEALDYLHSQRVAHRDIKPQNLLMLRGYAKVADFGLARELLQATEEASMVCGTPHYMAPEVWKGQISTNTDQYSLAATYVEMRIGRRLFPGKTPYEIAEHHIKSEPQMDPLPPVEQAVLRRALAKDPDQRFPTCVAFAKALHESVVPKKVAPPAGTSWRVKGLLASMAVGLATLFSALVYAWMNPHPIMVNGTPPATTQPVELPWLPTGWEPGADGKVVNDPRTHRDYYQRLVRNVRNQHVTMIASVGSGGALAHLRVRNVKSQQVVVIAIPPKSDSDDPALFYIMENKVWNDLYRVYMDDPASKQIRTKYDRIAPDRWILNQWEKGAWAPGQAPNGKELGTTGSQARVPVFRVTATEAHCFAEWLGGRLPQKQQWIKAVGRDDDKRPDGPFNPDDWSHVGVGFDKTGKTGPLPVDEGDQDVSVFGCRQVAGNGHEWTRTVSTGEERPKPGEKIEEIPLTEAAGGDRKVYVGGQTYAARSPLTWKDLPDGRSIANNQIIPPEITFRVVLEPQR